MLKNLFEDSAQKHGKKKVAVGDHDLWIGAGNSSPASCS